MAEEHVVLHKERYQRLLDQLNEKKKHDTIEEEEEEEEDNKANPHNPSSEQNTSVRKNSSDALSVPSTQGGPENQRTRDDVVFTPQSATPEPPGITPHELHRLVQTKNNRVKKNYKKGPQKKTLKSITPLTSSKETKKQQKKTLNLVKKNWALMK